MEAMPLKMDSVLIQARANTGPKEDATALNSGYYLPNVHTFEQLKRESKKYQEIDIKADIVIRNFKNCALEDNDTDAIRLLKILQLPDFIVTNGLANDEAKAAGFPNISAFVLSDGMKKFYNGKSYDD